MAGPGNSRRPLRQRIADESGGVLVFVAIGLPMFLAMIALVMDIGLARLTQTRLQIAADAAAFAAARHGADVDAARAAAQSLADANYPGMLDVTGVELVHWDAATGSALAADPGAGRPANAVQVLTRRDEGLNSVLPYVFGGAAGLEGEGFRLAARAIATFAEGGGCTSSSGIFTSSSLNLRSGGSYETVCLYGRNAVSVSADVSFDDATAVISEDRDDIDEPARSGNGVAAVLDLVLPDMVGPLVAATRTATAPPADPDDVYAEDTIEATIEHGRSSRPSNSNSYMCSTGRERRECAADDPFTHHIWERSGSRDVDIDLPNNVTYRNLILQTDGDIEIGNQVVLENVTLWAGGEVELGNGAELTDVRIFAVEDVSIGAGQPANNVTATDVTIWAGADIEIAAQNSEFNDLVLHAGDRVVFGGRGTGSGQVTNASGVVIYAGDDIVLRNNVYLFATRMFAGGAVTFEDSNNDNLNIRLGDAAGACPGGVSDFENYVFASGAIDTGDHNAIHGTQFGGLSGFDLGADAVFIGSSAEVSGRAEAGVDTEARGCDKRSAYGAVDTSGLTGGAGGGLTLLVR